MAILLKALAGISAFILLVVTLLGSIITLGGFLLTAIKVLIVVNLRCGAVLDRLLLTSRPPQSSPRSLEFITNLNNSSGCNRRKPCDRVSLLCSIDWEFLPR